MSDRPHRRRVLLELGLLLAVLLLAAAPPARAAMAVVDATAIQQLTTQLNQLRKQFGELVEINGQLKATVNAIGAAGKITLPGVDLARQARRFRRDSACLLPDWRSLMPTVDFDDLDLVSICRRSQFYASTLFADRAALGKLKSWDDRVALQNTVEDRRRRLLLDATTKSLAQADENTQSAADLTRAADELEAALDAAQTSQDRQTVMARAQTLNVRALGAIVLILSQMQRADAAWYVKAGLRKAVDLPKDGKTPDPQAPAETLK